MRVHPLDAHGPGPFAEDLARYSFEDMKRICAMSLLLTAIAFAQDRQWVEGFDKVEFHHNAARNPNSRDFRGMARGYMTAGWSAAGR